MKRLWSVAVLAIVAASSPGFASAAVTCGVDSTELAFGSFSPLSLASSPVDSNATVTLGCTWDGSGPADVSYSIALSSGGAGGFAPRRMSSGSHTLDYNIYKAGYAAVWGDGAGSTQTEADSWTIATANVQETRNHTAYGRIAAGQQTAHIGSYSDTIIITVSY